MITRRTLALRLFLMILLTGILPMVIISGVSLLLVRPVLTGLDTQDAIEEMDHVLDIIERELNNQAVTAKNIISTNPGLVLTESNKNRQVLMDLYKIDFLAESDGTVSSDNPYWIRNERGIEENSDLKRFLDTALEGPYARGRLVPWGFVSTGAGAEIHMLSSSEDRSGGKNIVMGQSLNRIFSSYRRQYPDRRIEVSPAPADYPLKTIASFNFDDEISLDAVRPEAALISIQNNIITESVVLSVPYLETGLMVSLTQPAQITVEGVKSLIRALVIIAVLLVLQIVIVTFWSWFRLTRPLGELIHGIEEWDGLRLPDFGSLKSRSDEIGTLSRTFLRMSGEIRSKTRSLEDQAVRDGLTGLYNRRRFDETLQKEWDRHKREGNHLSLIMADIDFFKLYNDSYGHQEGDECLRIVAQACRRGVHRPGDLPFRYGGEEFSMILADTSIEGAGAVAENIRKEIEGLNISNSGSPSGGKVTMSFGVAGSSPEAEISKESLVRSADEALYKAKNSGRNKVVSN